MRAWLISGLLTAVLIIAPVILGVLPKDQGSSKEEQQKTEERNQQALVRMARDQAQVDARMEKEHARREQEQREAMAASKKNALPALGLVQYYEANEVKADRELKRRTLVVQGIVDRVAKDFVGRPYVMIGRRHGGILGVQCIFKKVDETRLASLSAGQKVYIEGTVKGKMMNVLLDDCKLLD